MKTCKNKIGYVALAGSVLLAVGFAAVPGEDGNARKARKGAWYGSIEPIDGMTVARAAVPDEKPAISTTADIAENQSGTKRPVAVALSERREPVQNMLTPTRASLLKNQDVPQPALQPRHETSAQPAVFKKQPWAQQLQTAAWQPTNNKTALEDTTVDGFEAPVRSTAAKPRRKPAAGFARVANRASLDTVRITPAGGHVAAGQSDSNSEEHTGTENPGNWYDWFWPLGHRVGVDKLKDEYVPFRTERSDEKAAARGLNTLPDRPELLVEVGNGFLETGNLHPGFEVPLIGAVWQPRLWAYLINRTAIQSFNSGAPGSERETEIANRLDIFFNLQLTGTEKILLGLRPVDRNRPLGFTRYTFDGSREGFNDNFRVGLETLFFEGDLGSLFPVLDQAGVLPIDLGFTVGRQPLIFQEGILINDTIDAVGFIRNNIAFPGTSNLRVSGIYGWNRVDRNDGNGGDENLFGLFVAADTHLSTLNLDTIFVEDEKGDGFYAGFAAIQRLPHFGGISSAFRVNSSIALDDEIPDNVLGTGVLLTSELSKIVKGSEDIVYFNSFLGLGNYTQAGREPVNGGPLANTGILFASPNLSTYLAEINPFIDDDVVGGAVGYQAFWDDNRRNLILEIAGRKDLSGNGFDSLGFGFQLQQAVGQHVQLQFEGFYTINEGRQDGSGVRAEVLFVL